MLLLDKPRGLSSNAALQRAKRLYAAEKAGHTGTLDPLATGLLPLCFGDATKFAQVLLDARKEYVATRALRHRDDDRRRRGRDRRAPARRRFTRAELEAALPRFVGTIRADAARATRRSSTRGATTTNTRAPASRFRARRARSTIDAIELVEWAPPVAVLRVACGKGTYIRVLAEDLGGGGRQLRASGRAAPDAERGRSARATR